MKRSKSKKLRLTIMEDSQDQSKTRSKDAFQLRQSNFTNKPKTRHIDVPYTLTTSQLTNVDRLCFQRQIVSCEGRNHFVPQVITRAVSPWEKERFRDQNIVRSSSVPKSVLIKRDLLKFQTPLPNNEYYLSQNPRNLFQDNQNLKTALRSSEKENRRLVEEVNKLRKSSKFVKTQGIDQDHQNNWRGESPKWNQTASTTFFNRERSQQPIQITYGMNPWIQQQHVRSLRGNVDSGIQYLPNVSNLQLRSAMTGQRRDQIEKTSKILRRLKSQI